MPAAGATAGLPSSLDRVKPPSPVDRAELLSPSGRCKPPALSDRCESSASNDRAALAPPLEGDRFWDALLRWVEPVAAAWAAQDAELDAEIAALEAAGVFAVPAGEQWLGLAFGPQSAPPDGPHVWLADLPGPLFDEDLAATAVAAGPGNAVDAPP